VNIPGGFIDIGSKRFNVQTSGTYSTLEDVASTIINSRGKETVFVRDIAHIGFEDEEAWFDYRVENHPEFLERVAEARKALRAGLGVPLEDVGT